MKDAFIQVHSVGEGEVAVRPAQIDLGCNSLYEHPTKITICKNILQRIFIYSRAWEVKNALVWLSQEN